MTFVLRRLPQREERFCAADRRRDTGRPARLHRHLDALRRRDAGAGGAAPRRARSRSGPRWKHRWRCRRPSPNTAAKRECDPGGLPHALDLQPAAGFDGCAGRGRSPDPASWSKPLAQAALPGDAGLKRGRRRHRAGKPAGAASSATWRACTNQAAGRRARTEWSGWWPGSR
ncbi:MAG: hypothetical protein MZV70_29935 [Desulfobacterales bacterium]|nr:hypothetical protein [Desulfobacterales bacterium]